jgi:AAA domain/Primase C terminal 2 (PriCT-2)/Bifunctional DNA primase/polymerase, N-terminal
MSAGISASIIELHPPDPAALLNIAAQRDALWAAGYRPLAVYSFNHPDRVRAGKAPLGDNWQKRARQDPPEVTRFPAVQHAANTGILADGMRVLDIDVDDLTVANKVRVLTIEMLGDTIVRYRANSGRCSLPYRAANGSPPKRVTHPSGATLEWFPVPPTQMHRNSIPEVTEEQISKFFAAAADIVEAEPEPSRNKEDQHYEADGDQPRADILDVIAALAVIPNDKATDWEFWNSVGMAAWAASGGSSFGYTAWAAWSAKHPQYDAAACRERWKHYPTSPPDKTGAGKLFSLAAKAMPGWQRPSQARGDQKQETGAELLCRPPTISETAIPRRIYIVPGYIQRSVVTEIVGPGGHGKSLLFLAWAVALALGEPFGRFTPSHPMRVATLDVEDDLDEQDRRVHAILRMFNKRVEDLSDRLLLMNPARTGMLLTIHPETRKLRRTQLMAEILAARSDHGSDLLMLNPLGELHDAEENDNGALRHVVGELRVVAKTEDIGLLIGHHTRKGAPEHGNADAGRGASSVSGVIRKGFTLYEMTPAEGAGWKLSDHRIFFRLDGAKANYDAKNATEWFERRPYQLDNEDHAVAPHPWAPPHEAVTDTVISDLMATVAAGDNGQPWSKRLGKYGRSIGRAMEKLGIASKPGQEKALDLLLAAGCTECTFMKPNRSPATGLRHPDGGPACRWVE